MLLLFGMSPREQQERGQRLRDRTQQLPQLGKAWVLILRPLLFKKVLVDFREQYTWLENLSVTVGAGSARGWGRGA